MADTLSNSESFDFKEYTASLREIRKSIEEAGRRMKETDRRIEETDRLQKETALQMKETDRKLGKLGNRFGEMIEYMVYPNLLDKFSKLGLDFDKAYQNPRVRDRKDRVLAEVDITLEADDKVMLVEVKSKPTTEDISEHVERVEKIRVHADSRNDKRRLMGAIAGMVFNDNEKHFAFKCGFYVIEPSGDTFNILVPEQPYTPREW